MRISFPRWLAATLQVIRYLFHACWTFFAGILFLLLCIICFWKLPQGQDLMILATEQQLFFIIFQVALIFLVLVSWYAARIVANAKQRSHRVAPGYLSAEYYKHAPRIIGFSFFTVLLLAFAQTPLYGHYVGPDWLYFLLLALSFPYYFMLSRFFEARFRVIRINRLFWITIVVILTGSALITFNITQYAGLVMLILLVLQACFLILVVTRREKINRKELEGRIATAQHNPIAKKTAELSKLPPEEIPFNFVFIWICLSAVAIYLACTLSVSFAVSLGSFSFVLLAFGILLGLGFMLTFISVRLGLNIHFIVLIIVYVFGLWTERHRVELKDEAPPIAFQQRDSLQQYFNKWIDYRKAAIDSSASYPVYFVLSDGGASRSGYWVASVLSDLQESSNYAFGDHLFCLSGASGGSVGNAGFYLLLKKFGSHPNTRTARPYTTYSQRLLSSDFLTYTLSRMLGHDLFIQMVPWSTKGDRAKALVQSLEKAPAENNFSLSNVNLDIPMSQLASYRSDSNAARLPILCINTTQMQDGRPSVISTIYHDIETFNNRLDVLNVLPPEKDMKLSTAVVLGASFPYLSPAGRIDEPAPWRDNGRREHYFVDGGYVDNSGAGVVHEMLIQIQRWMNDAQNDSIMDPALKARYNKLRFRVIHISNGPSGDKYVTKVNPFVNDLAAPIKTMFGSYSIQTTINDSRLKNFITHIDPESYYDINLFRVNDTMKYSMNWVISSRTLDSMNVRLHSPEIQQPLNDIVAELK